MQRRSKHLQPTAGPEKAFGQALRALRLERGFSQEQLGFECDVDRTYVSLLERGVKSPTLRTMFRLCEILTISFPELAHRVAINLDNQPTGKKKSEQKP